MADRPIPRPTVLVVAHGIDRAGQGMERLHARLIEGLADRFRFVVVTGSIDQQTRSMADAVIHVPLPKRPIPLRFILFAVTASVVVWRVRRRSDLVHTCGAIVVNPVDFVSVHLCQAGVVEAMGGRYAPVDAPLLRRVNTATLKRMALALERRSFARGATAMVVADRGVAEIERFYPSTPVVVTPNAVPAASGSVRARTTVRHELGLTGTRVLLLVGGDWALRGVSLVVAALGALPDDVHLIVAGEGDRRLIEAAAAHVGVADRVHLLGQRHDLDDLYSAADLLVQASAYETFSLVLVEAARASLPIVTTDVGVASTLLGDASAPGLTMVERSTTSIASGVLAVLADPRRAQEMAGRARLRSEAFTDERLVVAVATAYDEALRR